MMNKIPENGKDFKNRFAFSGPTKNSYAPNITKIIKTAINDIIQIIYKTVFQKSIIPKRTLFQLFFLKDHCGILNMQYVIMNKSNHMAVFSFFPNLNIYL